MHAKTDLLCRVTKVQYYGLNQGHVYRGVLRENDGLFTILIYICIIIIRCLTRKLIRGCCVYIYIAAEKLETSKFLISE